MVTPCKITQLWNTTIFWWVNVNGPFLIAIFVSLPGSIPQQLFQFDLLIRFSLIEKIIADSLKTKQPGLNQQEQGEK